MEVASLFFQRAGFAQGITFLRKTLKYNYRVVNEDFATITSDMQNSDYLVLYPAVQNTQPESAVLMQAFQNIQPEKTIYISGLEYVSIYKISDIPESVCDILKK